MTPKVKIYLALAIALLLGGVGYFSFFIAKKWPEQNKLPEKPVDEFAKWQTYYGWKKGFEIKIPPQWSKNFDHDGSNLKHKDKFWRDQIGEVEFLSSAIATDTAKFGVLIKDSDLVLTEFAPKLKMEQTTDMFVGELSAKKERSEDQERVLIQDGRKFFYLVFTSTEENFSKDILIWEKILSTFITVSQTK